MRQHEKREIVFKLLFMRGFHPEEEMPAQAAAFLEGLEELSKVEEKAILEKYEAVSGMEAVLDEELDAASEGWKTTRMSRVDLCALRLALYEIVYDDSVPAGVAINEAVEISKAYGGESSGAFVNGILGKIARNRGIVQARNTGRRQPQRGGTAAKAPADQAALSRQDSGVDNGTVPALSEEKTPEAGGVS